MIKKIKINQNEYIFGHRTFITSEKNSKGKTTLIRSILFGMGLIQSPNFVDGTKIKNIEVELIMDIKDKEFTFIRTSSSLHIFVDKALIKSYVTKNQDYLNDLLSWFDTAYSFESGVMKAILYSNYIDQQYGNHVINKGRTGFLPNRLKFSLKELIKTLDKDFEKKNIIEMKISELKEFEKNIEYISKYSTVTKPQLELNFFQDNKEAVDLSSLIIKKDRLENRKKYFANKKVLLNDVAVKLLDLDLLYKDKDGQNHKITIENIRESKDVESELLEEEIKQISLKIADIEERIQNSRQKLLSSGFKPQMVEAELLKRRIERSKSIETDSQVIDELKTAKKDLEDDLNNIIKNMDLTFYKKISKYLKSYLIKFNDEDNTLGIFIDSIDNDDYTFIQDSSTWSSYVGAIRFAIGTSLKLAISDLLIEKKVNFPIIIDKLIHEELDDQKTRAYHEIILNRSEQLIIANIENPFPDEDMVQFENNTILLNKDIVEDDQITLFSTKG